MVRLAAGTQNATSVEPKFAVATGVCNQRSDIRQQMCLPVCTCSEDVDYDAFGRDLQSFFTELESLNSSLVVTADPSAGAQRSN